MFVVTWHSYITHDITQTAKVWRFGRMSSWRSVYRQVTRRHPSPEKNNRCESLVTSANRDARKDHVHAISHTNAGIYRWGRCVRHACIRMCEHVCSDETQDKWKIRLDWIKQTQLHTNTSYFRRHGLAFLLWPLLWPSERLLMTSAGLLVMNFLTD